jgi:hypothetical protein
MPALAEVETAAAALSPEQQKKLLDRLYQLTRNPLESDANIHSVLDIPTVSLGGMIQPASNDDLLGGFQCMVP